MKDSKNRKPSYAPFLKALSTASTLIFLYIALSLLIPGVSLFGRYQHYVILTGSMRPTIEVGDVVFINNQTSLSEMEDGDIVAFYADVTNDGQDDVVVHYVHTIDRDAKTFTTRPENTMTPDPWTLSQNDLIGSYAFRIPRIGRFMLFAQSALGRIVIVVNIVLLYIIYQLWNKEPSKKDEPT